MAKVPRKAKYDKVSQMVDGEIATAEIAAQAITEAKLKRQASGKIIVGQGAVDVAAVLLNGDATMDENGTVTIADDAVSPANILGFAKDSNGVTIVALTAAIGAPGTLNEGAIYVVKDTADADKIKLVAVKGGAFYVGAALTAAA